MTMKMNRAFNGRMQTKMIRYDELEGYYDDNNKWIDGPHLVSTFFGVILAGNKFSQFDEGIARVATEAGERFSNYRTLYVQDRFPRLNNNDKVNFKGTYYNVLQESDEAIFGFHSYILEKPKSWTPNPVEYVTYNGEIVTHNGVPIFHST